MTVTPTTHLATIYAQALFDVALEKNALDDIATALSEWDRFLETEPLLKQALTSPAIRPAVQQDILKNLKNKTALPAIFMNFLKLLTTKRRGYLFPEIKKFFQDLCRQQENIRQVELTTPQPLKAAQEKHFTDKLSQHYNQKIDLHQRVDPSLYGGFTLFSEGAFIDGSLKGHLETLEKELKGHI